MRICVEDCVRGDAAVARCRYYCVALIVCLGFTCGRANMTRQRQQWLTANFKHTFIYIYTSIYIDLIAISFVASERSLARLKWEAYKISEKKKKEKSNTSFNCTCVLLCIIYD